MATAICPKCNGASHIERFNHVAQGVCFECHGTGAVEVTAAVAQSLADSIKPGKDVILPGFGCANITRDDYGFTATLECGQVWFSIVEGQIKLDTVSNGLVRRKSQIRGALQSACKVAA
jgi:DnaJ-class molecular chaperone